MDERKEEEEEGYAVCCPMIWREPPTSHLTVCFFRLTKISGFLKNSKNRIEQNRTENKIKQNKTK
jgi:hypothetical protein